MYNPVQSYHPLRKSDFWSEFGLFGEIAPKWLRNSDRFWPFAIVIDDISTSKSGLSEKCPKMVRKWSENGPKNVRICLKILNKIICMCLMCLKIFKCVRKWSENGPKMVRKWSENAQNWCVRIVFWGLWELWWWPGGGGVARSHQ